MDYLPVGRKADAVDTKFKTKVDDWIGLEKQNPGKYLVILLGADKDYLSQLMALKQHGFKTVVAYNGERCVSDIVKLQAKSSGEMVDWSETRAAAGGYLLDDDLRALSYNPHCGPPAPAATGFGSGVAVNSSSNRIDFYDRKFGTTAESDWGDLRRGHTATVGTAKPAGLGLPTATSAQEDAVAATKAGAEATPQATVVARSGGQNPTQLPKYQGGENEKVVREYIEDTLKQWLASPEGSSPGAAIAFTGFQPRDDRQRKRFNYFVHSPVQHYISL